VRYSEGIAREAVQRFIVRRLRELFDLKVCVVAVGTIGYLCWLVWNGDRSWWVGAIAAVLVLIPVGLAAVYAAHWRDTVGRIRQMQVPMARFTLNDAELSMASELGSATIPWPLIVEIWEFPGLWLLLLSKSYFVTLPTDGVPAPALQFMRDKVIAREGAAQSVGP
jgi:YcxB-like protein